MQELIERLDKTEKQLEKENNLVMSSALFAAKNMAIEALEKEKEQIIELPSDEEISKYIEKTFYGVKKHYFKAGVEFMRELILNQNK